MPWHAGKKKSVAEKCRGMVLGEETTQNSRKKQCPHHSRKNQRSLKQSLTAEPVRTWTYMMHAVISISFSFHCRKITSEWQSVCLCLIRRLCICAKKSFFYEPKNHEAMKVVIRKQLSCWPIGTNSTISLDMSYPYERARYRETAFSDEGSDGMLISVR